MNTVILIIVDGIVKASWLFLLSVGLSIVYGVLRILNLAHGSLYALGGFVAAILVTDWVEHGRWEEGTFLILFVAAALVGLASGPVIERGALQWIYGRDQALQLLATYALFLILEGLQIALWSSESFQTYVPFSVLGNFALAGVIYPWYYAILLGTAVTAGLILWAFLNRSRFGRLIAAVTYDREISRALGINLRVVYVITFTIGAFLAGLGGAMSAPMVSVVPGFAVDATVAAFAVVVIGGLGSIGGAAVGALVVGVAQAWAVHEAPDIEVFAIYLVMTSVLLIRPQGLFAREAVRRI
ncbi:MAG: branched-chain amino acid ABC transporter permease [Thermoleophilia bacterium]